jgi:hypothetical protein
MKVMLMALAAVGIVGSTTALLAETPVTPAEEKIKAALESFGCSGGKIEKEDDDNTLLYEIDEAKCKSGEYDIKLDKNFNVIIMLRD